jgi:hypothetical protein
MEFAAWTYPWDAVDETTATVADRLREIGITEINLATNYHTVQAFLPHNPQRRTLFAEPCSYFQPSDCYDRLKPVPYTEMEGDWVRTIAEELPNDMRLTSWTVGTHNSRLGSANRDCCLENAYADDLVFGLCPSTPAVADYLVNLVNDLANRNQFDSIELETFDYFYGTGFGWHHQKIHADLGPLGEFLLGLCFCTNCRSVANEFDVDVGRARRTVRNTIDAIVDGAVSSDDAKHWLDDHPTVAAYAAAREHTLEALFGRLAEAADDVDLGYYAGMPEPGSSWMVGANIEQLADYVDYYVAPVYRSSRESVVAGYNTVAESVSDVPVHAGVLPGHPHVDGGKEVTNIVDGLSAAGAERIAFYNYGLLPNHALEWIGAATASHR